MGHRERALWLKILYQFDDRTACIAKSSRACSVVVAEKEGVGQVDLATCLETVRTCSPDVLMAESDDDYAVYSTDYSEEGEPSVGHGALSGLLDGSEDTLIGRLCSGNAPFGKTKPSLQVKLRFVQIRGRSLQRRPTATALPSEDDEKDRFCSPVESRHSASVQSTPTNRRNLPQPADSPSPVAILETEDRPDFEFDEKEAPPASSPPLRYERVPTPTPRDSPQIEAAPPTPCPQPDTSSVRPPSASRQQTVRVKAIGTRRFMSRRRPTPPPILPLPRDDDEQQQQQLDEENQDDEDYHEAISPPRTRSMRTRGQPEPQPKAPAKTAGERSKRTKSDTVGAAQPKKRKMETAGQRVSKKGQTEPESAPEQEAEQPQTDSRVEPDDSQCVNCGVNETCQWRVVSGLMLCNPCGLYFINNQRMRPAALFNNSNKGKKQPKNKRIFKKLGNNEVNQRNNQESQPQHGHEQQQQPQPQPPATTNSTKSFPVKQTQSQPRRAGAAHTSPIKPPTSRHENVASSPPMTAPASSPPLRSRPMLYEGEDKENVDPRSNLGVVDGPDIDALFSSPYQAEDTEPPSLTNVTSDNRPSSKNVSPTKWMNSMLDGNENDLAKSFLDSSPMKDISPSKQRFHYDDFLQDLGIGALSSDPVEAIDSHPPSSPPTLFYLYDDDHDHRKSKSTTN
ncbi:hypothetical protein TRICI_004470 [Trichomonascus ciferrii]|uniref:GATA-type domain-containing protein n=1 Tax=Trichomonascus ciferrii TaxID=44093 RepID=A0A642V0Y1_9ASCO|nr:hypothetical protein TRICI_004470 [Trichomonascus ciferrii]